MKKTFITLGLCLGLYLIYYNSIFCDSTIYVDENIWPSALTTKNDDVKQTVDLILKGETPSWLARYAPVLWFHPNEKYKITDPEELLENAEIWYREVYSMFPFISKEFKQLGYINNESFKKINYNGFTPLDNVTRIHERGSLKNGMAGFEIKYDPEKKMTKPSVLFWRISQNPLFSKIQNNSLDELLLPIEFWFHYNYNDTGIGIANHDGDWESTLILFKLKPKDEKVTAFMVANTAHGGSHWHCSETLEHRDTHIELFSAVGTHATYVDVGNHWRGPYPDRTEKGEAWESWKLIKPVTKEYFYGFSGSWGRSSFINFQGAPIAPGPHFKYLPAETNLEKALAEYNAVASSCAEK